MKPETTVRKWRVLIFAGAVALMLGMSAKIAPNSHKAETRTVTISSDVLKGTALIVDGSESTGGKPPKPHS